MVINSPVVWLEFTLPTCGLKSVTLWESLSLSLSPLGRSYLSRFWTSLLPPLACTEGLYFFWLGMMADEVTDRLENMKLTTEEEDVIMVSDEERKDEIESCE